MQDLVRVGLVPKVSTVVVCVNLECLTAQYLTAISHMHLLPDPCVLLNCKCHTASYLPDHHLQLAWAKSTTSMYGVRG